MDRNILLISQTVDDVVTRILLECQQQLVAQIDAHYEQSNHDPGFLLEPFEDELYWWDQEPYRDISIEFDWFEGGLKQMFSAFEMFHDTIPADVFSGLMRTQLMDFVKGRIEFLQENEVKEKQEKLKYDFERLVDSA